MSGSFTVQTVEQRERLCSTTRAISPQGWRDDGIALYADRGVDRVRTERARAGRRPGLRRRGGTTHLYYLASGNEAAARTKSPFMLSPATPAFSLCPARAVVTVAPETLPAMGFASDFTATTDTFAEATTADGSNDCGEVEAFASVGQPWPDAHKSCAYRRVRLPLRKPTTT